MARNAKKPGFDEIVGNLRALSFNVASDDAVANAVLVTKHGIAAVIAPAPNPKGAESAAVLVTSPGVLVRGKIARLLDRGFQKYIKTSQYELPATADQLRAIHAFTEELSEVAGVLGLYNDGLGTTSDLYQYDRLRGREKPSAPAARPWELTESH